MSTPFSKRGRSVLRKLLKQDRVLGEQNTLTRMGPFAEINILICSLVGFKLISLVEIRICSRGLNFGAFCLAVRTLTFCQLIGFPN